MPPAGGEGEPPWHRVVVERHHHPDVPVTDGPQRASVHPGGRHRGPAEHHGRERSGETGQRFKLSEDEKKLDVSHSFNKND